MIGTIFVVIIITTLLLFTLFRDKKSLPGPWNLPIIGYLHKLNPVAPYLTLTELVDKYGPVYTIKLGLINVVAIADAKIVKKVLAKDETLTRPPLYMLNTIFENKGFAFAALDLWRDQRKFVANFLKTVGAVRVSPNRKACEASIREYAEEFVQAVESQNHSVLLDPSELVTLYVNNVAGSLILGKQLLLDKKTAADLTESLDKVAESIAFGGPLNVLPFLSFLPKFRKSINELKEAMNRIREIERKVIDECQTSFSEDTPSSAVEAFLSQMSKGAPKHIYNLDQLHYLLFDLFLGSTESGITTLRWTLLYLAQYQDVQNKIRQELLEVEMEDFANLHYTKAAIAEVTRIRTLAPLGIPHYAAKNISVENFTIPKGAMIMPLLWAIHMDPKIHKEPDEFRPERFLDNDGKFFKPESFLPFQSGKRMCVGEELAHMMMQIFVVIVLKNFEIGRPEGCPLDFTGVCGASLTPKPQKIIFKKI